MNQELKFSELIKKNEEKLKRELAKKQKSFVDQVFYDEFIKYPEHIQSLFFSSFERIFKQENLPVKNISSLDSKKLDFYIRSLDQCSSLLNFFLFHEKMKNYYEIKQVKLFFEFNRIKDKNFDTEAMSKITHLQIIRGLFSLLEPEIIMNALIEFNLVDIMEESFKIEPVMIKKETPDHTERFIEKFNFTKNLCNF